MIREAVETLGPPGALLSEDGVLRRYGPEPIHEAQAIVDALTKMLNEPQDKTDQHASEHPDEDHPLNPRHRLLAEDRLRGLEHQRKKGRRYLPAHARSAALPGRGYPD
jgi:hypothetical protein